MPSLPITHANMISANGGLKGDFLSVNEGVHVSNEGKERAPAIFFTIKVEVFFRKE